MTKEQAKQLLPLIQAYSEGKIIQIYEDGKKWTDLNSPNFDGVPEHYRIKPEPPKPTYRPWTSEEVPVGAAIREIKGKVRAIITIVNENGVILSGLYQSLCHFSCMYEEFECSTDFGKTWQPCGVLVNE